MSSAQKARVQTEQSEPEIRSSSGITNGNASPYQNEYSIFAGMDSLVQTIPEMPTELREYDYEVVPVSGEEAEAVFLIWLRSRLTNQPVFKTSQKLICHEVDSSVFFPEHDRISVHDYDGGEDNLDFKIAWAEYLISLALAKQTCAPCPVRVQCLTEGILDDMDKKDIGGSWGIWGGWGYYARPVITAKFNSMRRYYQRGLRSMSEGLRGSDYKGMPPAQIRKTEKRALELELSQ